MKRYSKTQILMEKNSRRKLNYDLLQLNNITDNLLFSVEVSRCVLENVYPNWKEEVPQTVWQQICEVSGPVLSTSVLSTWSYPYQIQTIISMWITAEIWNFNDCITYELP